MANAPSAMERVEIIEHLFVKMLFRAQWQLLTWSTLRPYQMGDEPRSVSTKDKRPLEVAAACKVLFSDGSELPTPGGTSGWAGGASSRGRNRSLARESLSS